MKNLTAEQAASPRRRGRPEGSGGPRLSPDEATKPRSMRLNDTRWARLQALGREWLERQIDRAKSGAAPAEVSVPPEAGEDLAMLRLKAARYDWLRERSVRLQGSDIWWSGMYLDTRVDTGLGHVQGEYVRVPEPSRGALNKAKP